MRPFHGGGRRNGRLMTSPPLDRLTFKTSRLAEFCSQKELVNQTGHGVEHWPLVVLKELVDNAIDAAEEAGNAPIVQVEVTDSGITIADNGPGMAPETVAEILDYGSRVSSREAYVSPTRGAQGNALKTLIAMGFALDGQRGETVIESRGVAHRIAFSIDPIRQEPRIAAVCEGSSVKNGIRVTVGWPDSASSILDDARNDFLRIVEDFAWVNPHLTLAVTWDRGDQQQSARLSIAATDTAWCKWRPSDPTSAHWYDEARLSRLMANVIAYHEDHSEPCPTVWAFVRQFRGLSATAKARHISEVAGASRLSLADFYGDGDTARVGALLDEMRRQSRPVKPRDLGLIGEAHLRTKFESLGVAPQTFDYRKAEFEHEGLPYLSEFAFGYRPKGASVRRILTGLNWSAAIGSDPFRRLGPAGESLDAILTKQRAGRNEPIVAVLHLACPRLEYLDRGKSSVAIPGSRSW
jgi:hypothetical protein